MVEIQLKYRVVSCFISTILVRRPKIPIHIPLQQVIIDGETSAVDVLACVQSIIDRCSIADHGCNAVECFGCNVVDVLVLGSRWRAYGEGTEDLPGVAVVVALILVMSISPFLSTVQISKKSGGKAKRSSRWHNSHQNKQREM